MSRVQPPGSARESVFEIPFAKKRFGGGHVVSDGLMKSSILNGPFVKWLSYGVGTIGLPARIVPLHTFERGGTVRLTSSCGMHVYAVPETSFWVEWAAYPGPPMPLTPSQPS